MKTYFDECELQVLFNKCLLANDKCLTLHIELFLFLNKFSKKIIQEHVYKQMTQWNIYILSWLSGEWIQKLKKKKKKKKLEYKRFRFLNKNMQVEKSNVCFGMINEWNLCS